MKIKDKRHDYYDIGLGLGHDPNDPIVYVREEKRISIPYGGRTYEDHVWMTIGFCGEIHRVLEMRHWNRSKQKWDMNYCYDMGDVDRFAETFYNKSELEVFQGDRQKIFADLGGVYRRCSRKKIEDEFGISDSTRPGAIWVRTENKQTTLEGYRGLFAKHNTPIFLVDVPNKELVINPLLRNYQFARVYDPYTAYQKIEQYVGGVLLAPVNPIPPVPDEIMVEIKGFDPKWSFRKPPQGG